MNKITPAALGNENFKKDFNLKYAYIAGSMYKGIASTQLVIQMAKAGLMSYFGVGGLSLSKVEVKLLEIQHQLERGQSYGMNLLCNLARPSLEEDTVDLFLRHRITCVEASAFMQITPALVWYRLKGVSQNQNNEVEVPHHILAKVSRPEVAQAFMEPAPFSLVKQLVEAGKLTEKEAILGEKIPMAHDICVEADSGGHTDQGVAYALMPAILNLRHQMMQKFHYTKAIRVGAAGGIGTPEAAAAAFIMGADFILTGSINQCTVEADTSETVKDMLQDMNVQDTAHAPAGDMFEIGARVQVLRKGVFFPARANKLYELYRIYNSIDEIDFKTQQQIQEKYFQRSFSEVWEETKQYYEKTLPEEILKAEQNAKHKMSLIFRWYFIYTSRLAAQGHKDHQINYQIHCGPALGAFNQWVKGTSLESWRNRHVDVIGKKIMQGAAEIISDRYQQFSSEGRL